VTVARGRKAYTLPDGGAGRSLGFSCDRCREAAEPATGFCGTTGKEAGERHRYRIFALVSLLFTPASAFMPGTVAASGEPSTSWLSHANYLHIYYSETAHIDRTVINSMYLIFGATQ
jgi:hypothetical protein